MKNLRSLLLASASILVACTSSQIDDIDNCEASFYEAIDSGTVNSVNGLTIAPQFSAYLFTEMFEGKARIMMCQCIDGQFAQAQLVFSHHDYHDYQPVLSMNGEQLYFTSTRPKAGTQAVRQNIWTATKSDKWTDATPIDRLVSKFWDGHAVEIDDHHILFASARADDDQMVDIFEFNLREENASPTRVNPLNSEITDNDLAFDPHSKTLALSRYDPETEDIDIFLSFRADDGWTTPVLLKDWSTPKWEMSPTFSPDGKYFLFMRRNEPFQRVLMAEVLRSIGDRP